MRTHVHRLKTDNTGKPDPKCDFGTRESPAVFEALDGIAHLHDVHAYFSKMTRFRDFGESPEEKTNPDPPTRLAKRLILIVTDPEWIAKIEALIAPEFPSTKAANGAEGVKPKGIVIHEL